MDTEITTVDTAEDLFDFLFEDIDYDYEPEVQDDEDACAGGACKI